MTVEYLDLAHYLAIAAEITGLDATTLTKVTRLSLADSAQFRAVASVRHVRALVVS